MVVASDAGAEDFKNEILEILEDTASAPKTMKEAQRLVKDESFIQAHEMLAALLEDVSARRVLPQVKLLLVFSKFRLGHISKGERDFAAAAEWFGQALDPKIRPKRDMLRDEHLAKIRRMRACCWYEVAKELKQQGEWAKAKAVFEQAERTKCLPHAVIAKAKCHIEECRCRENGGDESSEDDSHDAETDSLGDWLKSISPKNAEVWLEQFEEEGYEDVDDFLEADDEDRVELIESITDKKQLRKKVYRAVGTAKGTRRYVKGKDELSMGAYARAKQHFSELTALSDTDRIRDKVDRAKTYIEMIAAIEKAGDSVCVFDDLASQSETLGLSKRYLGLSTSAQKTSVESTAGRRRRALTMYLNTEFPKGEAERTKLIVQLYEDTCRALQLVRDRMRILDIDIGSVIVYFEFAGALTRYEPTVPMLRDEYVKQVNDSSSELWKGKATQHMDKEQTLKLTEQLGDMLAEPTPTKRKVGEKVLLARSSGCSVECKIVSLLGEGGNASVFRVNTNGKICALKVYRARGWLLNLCHEASILLSLNYPRRHPNVLRVDSVWYEKPAQEVFFLTEHVDGGDLGRWMNDERLYEGSQEQQLARLLRIAHDIGHALDHVHSLDILHLDVKPANVPMTKNGRAVLADFSESSQGKRGDDGVIRARMKGCTPAYASPNMRSILCEALAKPVAQRAARFVTQSDDVWCFAATVFGMFAECGWTRGQSFAGASHCRQTAAFRVPMPSGVRLLLESCFTSGQHTMRSIADAIEQLSTSPIDVPELGHGLDDAHCGILRNNLGLALHHQGYTAEAREQYQHAMRADNSSQTIKCGVNLGQHAALMMEGSTGKNLIWAAVQDRLRQVVGNSDHPVGCTIEVEGSSTLLIHVVRAAMWNEMMGSRLITDVGFLQVLRDQVLVGSFEQDLAIAIGQSLDEQQEFEGKQEEEADEDVKSEQEEKRIAANLSITVDKTHFAEMYELQMRMLDSLTPHQADKLRECLREGETVLSRDTHIRAPAGAGKTFLALHLMLQTL
eukprot:g2803.t1